MNPSEKICERLKASQDCLSLDKSNHIYENRINGVVNIRNSDLRCILSRNITHITELDIGEFTKKNFVMNTTGKRIQGVIR